DAVGFCLLFPVKQLALPSLYQAVARLRPGEKAKWDKHAELIWGWKDELPRRGRAFYAKYFKARGTFISLKLLPHFLSMRGSPTSADEHDEFYARGRISYDALVIWKTLAELGPLATLELRHACKMESKSGNAHYKKAMLELQCLLAVVHFGAEQETAAWPSSRFELTARAFPKQAAAARKISPADARRALATKYLEWHPGALPHDVQLLFGWTKEQVPLECWKAGKL
ncbi:MAG TPA: crosslink repair DNA glycosylase YcaQ family protein, partial [Candidatus Nitrosotenuis sp.]|nr:crosslink repair DNA glycosylase YcaQ family protein [Candidatus Nitrosotenuis sp.]